jgi:ketosteroid isomerase-like protein
MVGLFRVGAITGAMIGASLSAIPGLAQQARVDAFVVADSGRAMSAEDEYAFFRRYFVEYFKAWSPGTAAFDLSVAAPFYRHDDRLTAFDVFPPVAGFAGWRAYAEELPKIMANTAEFNVTSAPDSFRYGRNGDVVWASMQFRATGRTRSGAPIDVPARTTLVLERSGGKWLIVQEHVSTPLGGGG